MLNIAFVVPTYKMNLQNSLTPYIVSMDSYLRTEIGELL